MVPWSESNKHNPDEITLLCDRHHREEQSGLLPALDIQEANDDPWNLRSGVSKPYDLHFKGGHCEAIVGSNYFTTVDAGYGTFMVPVSVDGWPLIGFVFADEHLLLHLNIYDECNYPVLVIRNNQLLYSISPWDIQW